jgi:hypothetical protein
MARSRLVYSFPTITEGKQHSERIPRCINPGRDPDHNFGRNGADATDIRRRGGNSGIGRHHSNMASLVGNPDLRKCETRHLLLIRWASKQPIREQSIPIENIFSYDPFLV